jgi:Lon-like protease
VDTVPQTLPPHPAAIVAATRPDPWHRRWAVPLVVLAALPPIVVVGATLRTVDWFAITPGDATPSEARVKVPPEKSHVGKGDILFVTVGLPRLNRLAYDVARDDKDVERVPARDILGTKTPEQNRREDLQLMGYSKSYAAYVALRKLGYPVSVTGGGAAIDDFACVTYAADNKTCTSPAPAASVLKVHDVITAIDGKPVNVTPDISDALKSHRPGDVVDITFRRDGAQRTEKVELMKSTDGRTIVGIDPNPSPPDTVRFTFPFDVSIDTGGVGGPSAGLAFTLALLDKLTPGELANGVPVAATGEITPAGEVLQIGGLAQKTIAVMHTNAKVFLVPDEQKKEAEDEVKAKGGSLKIVGVQSIDDALAALADLGGNALQLGTPGAGT